MDNAGASKSDFFEELGIIHEMFGRVHPHSKGCAIIPCQHPLKSYSRLTGPQHTATLNPKRLGIYQRQWNLGIESTIFGSCGLVTDPPFDQSLWGILRTEFIGCGLATLNPKRLGIYQRQWNLGIESAIFGSCEVVTDQSFDQSLWAFLQTKFIGFGLATLNPKRLGIYQRQWNLGIESAIFGSCGLVTDPRSDQSLWGFLKTTSIC